MPVRPTVVAPSPGTGRRATPVPDRPHGVAVLAVNPLRQHDLGHALRTDGLPVLDDHVFAEDQLAARGLDPALVVVVVDDDPAPVEAMASRRLVVAVIGRRSAGLVRRLVLAGVRAIVPLERARDRLGTAVRVVLSGGSYLPPDDLVDLVRPLAPASAASPATGAATATVTGGLTRREQQTLRLIAAGYTHAQAARRMEISVWTVNTYVKRLREKLGPGNKAQLTQHALDLGVLG